MTETETTLEDQELLEKFREDNSRNYAFNLIVRKYQERVYWHIQKMVICHDDADDLTQEAFIKVFQALDKFKGDSQLFTWIYKIATNICLNHIKKKKRRSIISFSNYEKDLAETLVAHTQVSSDDVQVKLQKALLKLPEKQRLVFNMKYYEELKYEEMAQILGGSVGSLKASYHHAVKKIERLVSEY